MMKKLSREKRLYQLENPIIAITGGIACGKSTFSKIITEAGFTVLDADQLVKMIYKQKETLKFIDSIIPSAIIKGHIDFKILRRSFFKDKKLKLEIEKYVYAHLKKVFLIEYEKIKNKKIIFYDIPLLFENNMENLFDLTVCVYIPKEEQISRLIKRDHIDKSLAETIIASQIDIEVKRSKANMVIHNMEDHSQLKSLTLKFLNDLGNK